MTGSFALRLAAIIAAFVCALALVTPVRAWQNCGTPRAEPDCAAHGLPGKPPHKKPVPTLVPTSVPAAPVATPAPVAESPSSGYDNRPFVCHYEPSVGFATPRRSSHPDQDRANGDTDLVDGICLKPVIGEAIYQTPDMPSPAVVVVTPVATLEAMNTPETIPPAPVVDTSPFEQEADMPEAPEVHTPADLPDTGDGSTYLDP